MRVLNRKTSGTSFIYLSDIQRRRFEALGPVHMNSKKPWCLIGLAVALFFIDCQKLPAQAKAAGEEKRLSTVEDAKLYRYGFFQRSCRNDWHPKRK
jgi:hypothetical protein